MNLVDPQSTTFQRSEAWRLLLAERPMAEIAERLGVSESRISQIRAEALVLLRDAMNHALDPELVPVAERPDGCAARRRQSYFQAVASRHDAALRGRVPRSGLSSRIQDA